MEVDDGGVGGGIRGDGAEGEGEGEGGLGGRKCDGCAYDLLLSEKV